MKQVKAIAKPAGNILTFKDTFQEFLTCRDVIDCSIAGTVPAVFLFSVLDCWDETKTMMFKLVKDMVSLEDYDVSDATNETLERTVLLI
ncbi:hypothetical protein ColTof4_13577 [Colletotrichum tofieldiae]|nr:hypothetical protein ColTof4_13577 [Colletotrichum tofieldiae]GKT97335.1 hypothetical protein Ct61P_15185 [Colletotrichum tofieldiae]